jgi:recombination DNA repair RAD52 pathway protein
MNEERTPATSILWDWQIVEALQEYIKPEQISTRPDGKDYVEWHEATRIANRVFGPLGWSLTTTMTPTYMNAGDWGEGFYCTRKITVRYRCSEDSLVYTIERDGEGWIKLQAIGKSDAIDMAFKGAASDAISKATKTFGDAFGLNLYPPKGRQSASLSLASIKAEVKSLGLVRNPEMWASWKKSVLGKDVPDNKLTAGHIGKLTAAIAQHKSSQAA